jgi:hypothetical protein
MYLGTAQTHALPVVSSFSGPISLTIPAHRLITKAYEIGGPAAQSALMTPIFRAYYEDDLDISDPEVLADVAEQADVMPGTEVSPSHVACWRFPRDPPFCFSRRGRAFQTGLEGSWSLS